MKHAIGRKGSLDVAVFESDAECGVFEAQCLAAGHCVASDFAGGLHPDRGWVDQYIVWCSDDDERCAGEQQKFAARKLPLSDRVALSYFEVEGGAA